MARIRKSRREKPAAQAPTEHDIDFGHLWRQLRAAGWTSKRPTGLQTEWSYASPGRSSIFVGEHAVVDHAFQSGLLEESTEASQTQITDDLNDEPLERDTDEDAHEQLDCSQVDVRASQINTSVQLSQRTIDHMFVPPSDQDIELSQTAVTSAFGLAPGDLQVDDEHRSAAVGLHLLSEASGLESEGEEDDGETAEPTLRQRRHAALPAPSDVNVLGDGEADSDYENYSSSDGDGDGVLDEDSECGGDGLNEDDDVLSDSDAVDMDEAFLASLQIGSGALDSAALSQREKTLRAEEARPVAELLGVWRSPLLTVFYFLPKSMWVNITAETNRCHDILRDLHFVDNTVDHGQDKLWKLRPVVDKIQERFLTGWTLPSIFSFDEGVLPATSRRNTTCMFMSDKPHRYGSKLFMLCDAKTSYCHRFEVYVGKRATVNSADATVDYKTGAAAVLRNLKVVLARARHAWRTVVIDRYYSSVLLAVELLAMNVYVVGTIMTSRVGYNKKLHAVYDCLRVVGS
ncbi:hypothetical protein PHPALM_30560 [Phytophthora palmivora]|uniref:PiggyBac transposable element-derived protein domain-containing protein n=1 Tax=Phytophthora palmivora TaxID=4796 RepID=A0A2P4X4W1_9STRA|nr:hypothetical protein PHPALM_30560 [Phytophthora palmivora]